MAEVPFPSRTLSELEGAVLAWLEAERRAVVSADEVAATFGWPARTVNDVLARLGRKGWLRRTAKGRYETVLAETGGFAPPNPWAALSTWGQPYYVGFQSAAYEHDLTPDRPARVQAVVKPGARAPRAWADVPISLIALRSFNPEGVTEAARHGVSLALATPEKVLVDAGALPGRVGGPHGLARIVTRALPSVDWRRVVELAARHHGGAAALRRLAATLDVTGRDVPPPLAAAARVSPGAAYLYLGERRLHGAGGRRLTRWAVVDNIGGDTLAEETRR